MHDERDDCEEQEQMNHRAGDVKKYESAEPGDDQQNCESQEYESHDLKPPCVLESGQCPYAGDSGILSKKAYFRNYFDPAARRPSSRSFFAGLDSLAAATSCAPVRIRMSFAFLTRETESQ